MHKNWPRLLVPGPRISDVLTKILRDYGWEVLPHAPYIPDMSPLDFDLFPKVKEPKLGRRVSSLKEISTDDTQAIRHMNKSGVLDGITMLSKRWGSVIEI